MKKSRGLVVTPHSSSAFLLSSLLLFFSFSLLLSFFQSLRRSHALAQVVVFLQRADGGLCFGKMSCCQDAKLKN